MARQWLVDQVGEVVAAGLGGPIFTCRYTRVNNSGTRQTMQPRIPAWENKASKPLVVKICGGWGGGRNGQSHRRVRWRGPWGPRTYTSLPTWESTPEQHLKGHNSL